MSTSPPAHQPACSFTIAPKHLVASLPPADSGAQSDDVGMASPLFRPTPALPQVKRPSFSRHRHDANPALALHLLQDIQTTVGQWHSDLKTVVRQIQDLYREGPIVDGWLESCDPPQAAPAAEAAMLRHGDPEQLMGYVQTLANQSAAGEGAGTTQYRLCGLNAEGRVISQPCPPDQLVVVSLAIARHQKLRLLLNQKHSLETQLQQAVDLLTGARQAICGPTVAAEAG